MQVLLRVTLVAAALATATASQCVDCPEYVEMSARDKQDVIWNKIVDTQYQGFPQDVWYGPVDMAKILTESMDEPFDRFSDVFAEGRKKLIHTMGSVAKVKIVPDSGNPYTGLLASAEYGLARLSIAGKGSNFIPAMALKFMRDGTYSGNIISMFELSGQGTNYNIFENQLKTWVRDGKGLFLEFGSAVFSKGASDPSHLSVDGMAVADQDGTELPNMKFPEAIYFVPTKTFSSSQHDFREDLDRIKAGEVIYEIYGGEGCDCSDGRCQDVNECRQKHKIGSLQTASRFVASEFGDKQLFFQHYRGVKKARRTCIYDRDLPDSDMRLAGSLRAQCLTKNSCPSVGFLGWGGQPVRSTVGCPFHLNSFASTVEADNSWFTDETAETASTAHPNGNNSTTAVIVILCGLAFSGLIIFALARHSRFRGAYTDMERNATPLS